MKLRSFAGLMVVAALALGLTACEWSTSSEKNGDVTYGNVSVNFSGTYTAQSGSLTDRIKTFTVLQRNTKITLRDNAGGTYNGHITYASSSTSESGTTTCIYSFETTGTSSRGLPTTVVGTFEAFATAQQWDNSMSTSTSSSSSAESSDSGEESSSSSSSNSTSESTGSSAITSTATAKMTASFIEQGGSAASFIGVSYVSMTRTVADTSNKTRTSTSEHTTGSSGGGSQE